MSIQTIHWRKHMVHHYHKHADKIWCEVTYLCSIILPIQNYSIIMKKYWLKTVYNIPEELSMSCVTPLVEGCCESVIGFLCISPQTHFSSADFALYPFAVINLIHEYNNTLNLMNPYNKTPNLRIVLGNNDKDSLRLFDY